jgi:hypothetical protein
MGAWRWTRWALAPLHVAALSTGAKSFRDNPVLGSPTLNRLGLHAARVRLAHEMADRRRQRLAGLVAPEDAAAFERDGFVLKPGFLPADAFERLREEVLAYRGPARDMLQGDAVTRRVPLDSPALLQAPSARALLEDPRWLGLIGYVGSFRLRPVSYIQTIFARVRPSDPDPQTFLHADTFHATVKAWLFLQDVAAEDGPFVYAPGSHRLTVGRLAWERRKSIEAAGADFLTSRGSFRVTPPELQEMGLPPPRAFAVAANTLVVADTGGFHARGRSVGPSIRTEIWAYGRRNPFLPWTGFDALAFPAIERGFVRSVWAFADARERVGLKANPWRPTGQVGPRTPPDLGLWGA